MERKQSAISNYVVHSVDDPESRMVMTLSGAMMGAPKTVTRRGVAVGLA